MWVANCRGTFRCAGRKVRCGYPPGRPAYNCSCSESMTAPPSIPPWAATLYEDGLTIPPSRVALYEDGLAAR